MKFFACSDTHFGHNNILKYASRPFEDVESMNNHLVEVWNGRVREEDTVYFLGDFAMGPGVDDDYIYRILCRLNGQLKVVCGNHDQPNKKYKQMGLKKLVENDCEVLPDVYQVPIDDKWFIMSHYPMADWNGRYHGSIHLHGHTHTRLLSAADRRIKAGPEFTQYPNGRWCEGLPKVDNRFDIGVDMYGGPVEITGDLKAILSPQGWVR